MKNIKGRQALPWAIFGIALTVAGHDAAWAQAVAPAAGGVLVLPTIDVAPTTPSTGSAVDVARLPYAVTILSQKDIARANSPNVVKALTEQVPSLTVNESSGNTFQPDVSFRGFVASPVSGTPEGLAIYQNGVRINEAFGDTVNWDLIPTVAIRNIDVVSNNPAFGLNALGGAVTIQMQDGFNFQGVESVIQGGSFGRIEGSLQAGKQVGPWAAYAAFEGVHEDGFRNFSDSEVRRFYGDLGYKAEQSEFHINVGLASNSFGASASAPIELLEQNYSAAYTTPQTTQNKLGFVNITGAVQATPNWAINANAYLRVFDQVHVDGNTTDAQPCDDPTLLCFGDSSTPANGRNGQQLTNVFDPSATLGEIDRTHTHSTSAGTSLQATDSEPIFGHDNRFVIGASFDAGWTNFSATSELGTIDPNLVVLGSDIYLGASGDPTSIGPVGLKATNLYGGLFALDTFDVTQKFSITGGGRFNIANIDLRDQLGTALDGNDTYTRFNPVIGATFRFTPNFSAYGGYSEANRAPTPLELGCADPLHPCIIDNFLVSDPPLKQVVAHTLEAGLRGTQVLPSAFGSINWKFGLFRTENTDDILNVPSPIQGFGYFRNVGTTLRQGVEAEVHYTSEALSGYLSYAFVDATFRSSILLGSPNNPFADADGNILVKPGDQIPLVPRNRVKAGIDYAFTDAFKLGGDLLYVGSQYYVGDEANLTPKLPAYVTVGLHASYQLTKEIEIFGRIENLFDSHYYNYGTFFDTGDIAFANFSDPRSVSPGAPRGFYAGLRAKF